MHILAEAKIGLKTSGRKIFMGEIRVDFTESKTVNTEMQHNRRLNHMNAVPPFKRSVELTVLIVRKLLVFSANPRF